MPFATFTDNADDCIQQLGWAEWDVLFLDHDLGGEVYVDERNENTGSEVVRWMTDNLPKVNRVIIHSLNHDASLNMMSKLKSCGYNVDKIMYPNINFGEFQGN
jgi:hypothetical protein